MSKDLFSTFLSTFTEYQTAIEELRPLKRPMLLWSTVSLLYVFGGLQFADTTTSNTTSVTLWGFQIIGLTDTKLTIFFFLTTLYYTVRWLWIRHLRLRTYKQDGFMAMLRQYGMPRSREKETANHAYDLRKGYAEATSESPFGNEITAIEAVRSSRGAIYDLFNLSFSARVLSFVEHIFIPFLAPFVIAVVTLIALAVRLCCL